MKSIIQFPHPGGEHNAKTGIKWNTSSHKRKYLKVEGSYLKNLSSKPIDGTVYFWGEWEAPSKATPTGKKSPLPKFIFEPCYTLTVPNKVANTDPFVFGKQFYYCICKQGHYPSLRDLDKGSLIIFGSHKDSSYILDTLFVVKGWRDYKISEIPILKTEYNDVFYVASLVPMNNTSAVQCKITIEDKNETGICLPTSGDDESDNKPVKNVEIYRIYEAMMYDDVKGTDGIFSFAPCHPEPEGRSGFTRPAIEMSYISQGLNQGIKIINGKAADKVWNDITTEVLNKGLNLMIETALPKKCTNQVKQQ
jgi:hypothetical protein